MKSVILQDLVKNELSFIFLLTIVL